MIGLNNYVIIFCYKLQLFKLFNDFFFVLGGGGTLLVAQLVEALRYKPEGRGFDSRWCHWNFSLP
jgi:hypothetical protein